MRHLIAIHLQNEAGALTRVTGLISSRGYNIESLSVAPTNDPTVSRVTLVTIGSDQVIAQINAQLLKLVDVVAVEDMTGGDALARELLLIKLQILPKHVEAVGALLRRVGGKVLSPNPSSYIVELTMPEIEVKPEHAADPMTRRVGIMVGVVGILLSVVTIASHRAHTQAVIHRTESNDAWAYYQAKRNREYTSEVALTLLHTLGTDPAKLEAPVQKLEAARTKYTADAAKIQDDANAKDEETKLEERRALHFDIGEGFLELGLVLCSLFFLARNNFFPIFGVLASTAGTAMGVWGVLL